MGGDSWKQQDFVLLIVCDEVVVHLMGLYLPNKRQLQENDSRNPIKRHV